MTQATVKSKTILIVEDDLDTSFTLEELLRQNGYDVAVAVDRDDADLALSTGHIDMILLDYMMPGESASRFLRRVGKDYPNVRVILVTAADRAESIAKMLGIREFIGKPVIPEKLLELLAKDKTP